MEWHFAGLHNKWTRQSLAVVGFGRPSLSPGGDGPGNWCPAYSVATSLAGATERDTRLAGAKRKELNEKDEESRVSKEVGSSASTVDGEVLDCGGSKEIEKERSSMEAADVVTALQPIYGIDRPFFHIDLTDAVDTAVRDARRADLSLERATGSAEEDASNGR